MGPYNNMAAGPEQQRRRRLSRRSAITPPTSALPSPPPPPFLAPLDHPTCLSVSQPAAHPVLHQAARTCSNARCCLACRRTVWRARALSTRVRCVSIFLDKNRRYVGKSQPKRTSHPRSGRRSSSRASPRAPRACRCAWSGAPPRRSAASSGDGQTARHPDTENRTHAHKYHARGERGSVRVACLCSSY
jgi:hypothetical protein